MKIRNICCKWKFMKHQFEEWIIVVISQSIKIRSNICWIWNFRNKRKFEWKSIACKSICSHIICSINVTILRICFWIWTKIWSISIFMFVIASWIINSISKVVFETNFLCQFEESINSLHFIFKWFDFFVFSRNQ
jgi:hypothetical protein